MTLLTWPRFDLFEYEYELARREVRVLVDGAAEETREGFVVPAPLSTKALQSFTYFSEVVDQDRREVTPQRRIELVHRQVTGRTGSGQSTRYLVHDLHEYKGKFNPQMARALINVFGSRADEVIDPFCGSGTTVIEAVRLGKRGLGLDINPLAAWMSQIKVDVTVSRDPVRLLGEFRALGQSALRRAGSAKKPPRTTFSKLWDEDTQMYLESWFPPETFWPLARVLGGISESDGLAGELIRLAVSNITRQVSWQLPEDLRIRRRPKGWQPPDTVPLLARALKRVEFALVEQLDAPAPDSVAVGRIAQVDARAVESAAPPRKRVSRVIVTSPPYATALPYVDTDRLSIVLLGLSPSSNLKALDGKLTGSREWTRSESKEWDARMRSNADELPTSVLDLVTEISARNERDNAGFRRLAVPGLLYRYFADMGDAISSWSRVLSKDEYAVLVVGTNKTAGTNDPIVIDTPSLIADLAPSRGFVVSEVCPLQAWPRYGMHARNGVAGESAVVLRRVLDS